MPIPYAERKKRRQALLEGLHPDLRDRLALRHAEAAARLTPAAQRTLAGALQAGLPGISSAIATLQEQPDTSADQLLALVGKARKAEHMGEHGLPDSGAGLPRPPMLSRAEALAELSDLLESCFPDMPAITARALAEDELLSEALDLVCARQACLRSRGMRSEMVFVALCGLALRFVDDLKVLLASRPQYRLTLAQSALNAGCLMEGAPVSDRSSGGQPRPD